MTAEDSMTERDRQAFEAMVAELLKAQPWALGWPPKMLMEWAYDAALAHQRAEDAEVREAQGCDVPARRCRICWTGPYCGPFYGVQRLNMDEERLCPCECHAHARAQAGGA